MCFKTVTMNMSHTSNYPNSTRTRRLGRSCIFGVSRGCRETLDAMTTTCSLECWVSESAYESMCIYVCCSHALMHYLQDFCERFADRQAHDQLMLPIAFGLKSL